MEIQAYLRILQKRAGRTKLRAPLDWHRHLGLLPTDVFLAAFPRSGSTWLRLQLHEVLTRSEADFENIAETIPDVGWHRKACKLLPGDRRLIKTHERYRKEYKRAIYLVRDVRDVLVSYFHYQAEFAHFGRKEFGELDDYVKVFMEGKVSQYPVWQDHVASWLESPLAKSDNLLVIRYEDLRADPGRYLREVASYLGIKMDSQTIHIAVENNSFERMRLKENVSPTLQSAKAANGRFIRKGTVGGWRERLSQPSIELIERSAGPMMENLGYQLGSSARELPAERVAGAETSLR